MRKYGMFLFKKKKNLISSSKKKIIDYLKPSWKIEKRNREFTKFKKIIVFKLSKIKKGL